MFAVLKRVLDFNSAEAQQEKLLSKSNILESFIAMRFGVYFVPYIRQEHNVACIYTFKETRYKYSVTLDGAFPRKRFAYIHCCALRSDYRWSFIHCNISM